MAKRTITISTPNVDACPDDTCGHLINCSRCDGFILVPINPALLVAPALYLEGTIVSGPVTEGTSSYWMVEIEETLLTDPNASFSQCDYRVCCNDCHARFAKVLFAALEARIAALEGI